MDQVPERLATMPSWLLGQVANRVGRTVADTLGDRPGRSEFAVLAALEEAGPASQAEIGARTGLDRADLVRWLDRLGAAGLVRRAPDPADRRRNTVTLTASGRRELGRLDRLVRGAGREALGGLSDREVEQLVRLLGRALAG